MGTYKLYAFDIPEQGVVGRDFSDWEAADLSGNTPFQLSSAATISNYVDISGIEMWHQWGNQVLRDYQTRQKAVRLSFYEKGWSACTSTEKDLVLNYFANPDLGTGSTQSTQMVMYLMGKGYSLQEAKSKIIDYWFGYWDAFIEDCTIRFRKSAKVTATYLTFLDATELDITVQSLKGLYMTSGILGLGFGDKQDGIMNYVLSTYSFVGQGLEENNFTLTQGTWTDFKNDLYKELVDDKFWPDIKNILNSWGYDYD
jgi:hypothetical protein